MVRSSEKPKFVCPSTLRSASIASLSHTLLSDTPAIPISCVSDCRSCHHHHILICKRAPDLLLVSRAAGESNHAITRGQSALVAQTVVGKASVTIVTGLSGSVNACQMCSLSRQLQNPFVFDTNAFVGRRMMTPRLAGRWLPIRPAALTESINILNLDTRVVLAMLPSSTACRNRGERRILLWKNPSSNATMYLTCQTTQGSVKERISSAVSHLSSILMPLKGLCHSGWEKARTSFLRVY